MYEVAEFDLYSYHENRAGRLVVDPQYVALTIPLVRLTSCRIHREAKIEFGEEIASRLKLTSDGTKVLWPQPTDDPEDPQNVLL